MDIQAVVDTMSHAAVTHYYEDRRAGTMPFYLWYRPSTKTENGDLLFSPNTPGDRGWELVESQGDRGLLPATQLFNHVRTLAGRLPILAFGEPATQRR